MGLISKTVMVRWNGSNKKHYEELGYEYTSRGDLFEVKVKDLPKGSGVMIEYCCDNCGELHNISYCYYNQKTTQNGKVYCKNCANKLLKQEERRKTKLKKSKSFKQWCIEADRQDVLDRWDYKLNNCNPDEICYGTNKKYWFKCDKYSEHKSELKKISDFTKGQHGSIKCKQCNSIAQYILNNFPNKKLEDVWDFEKNEDLNPWNILYGSRIKIWIKCQNKDYHGSYEILCNNFSQGQRCGYCHAIKFHPTDSLGQYITNNYGKEFLNKVWSSKNKKSPFEYMPYSNQKAWFKCLDDKHEDFYRTVSNIIFSEFRCAKCVHENSESMLEEKTRIYLETLDYTILHEYDCTIKPKNPKTNRWLPFDNEIKELKLIIEVHGGQHYNSKNVWNNKNMSPKQSLHQRQLYDRYKRICAIQDGYNYLEIPYTAFDSKDTYKKLIDDKIKEILNKNY